MEKVKNIRKTRGFTLVELLTIITILGLLLMIAIPSMEQASDLTYKNLANTTHKILVNAVDYWIKDNDNPSQRPANFKAKNSQGKTVVEYISNNEVFRISTLERNGDTDAPFVKGERQIKVEFDEGILRTQYMKNAETDIIDYELIYSIYNLGTDGKVENYDDWKARNYIIESDYMYID